MYVLCKYTYVFFFPPPQIQIRPHTLLSLLFLLALFPSPHHGEVEVEGMPALARDVIKSLAYRASQDAAANAAQREYCTSIIFPLLFHMPSVCYTYAV